MKVIWLHGQAEASAFGFNFIAYDEKEPEVILLGSLHTKKNLSEVYKFIEDSKEINFDRSSDQNIRIHKITAENFAAFVEKIKEKISAEKLKEILVLKEKIKEDKNKQAKNPSEILFEDIRIPTEKYLALRSENEKPYLYFKVNKKNKAILEQKEFSILSKNNYIPTNYDHNYYLMTITGRSSVLSAIKTIKNNCNADEKKALEAYEDELRAYRKNKNQNKVPLLSKKITDFELIEKVSLKTSNEVWLAKEKTTGDLYYIKFSPNLRKHSEIEVFLSWCFALLINDQSAIAFNVYDSENENVAIASKAVPGFISFESWLKSIKPDEQIPLEELLIDAGFAALLIAVLIYHEGDLNSNNFGFDVHNLLVKVDHGFALWEETAKYLHKALDKEWTDSYKTHKAPKETFKFNLNDILNFPFLTANEPRVWLTNLVKTIDNDIKYNKNVKRIVYKILIKHLLITKVVYDRLAAAAIRSSTGQEKIVEKITAEADKYRQLLQIEGFRNLILKDEENKFKAEILADFKKFNKIAGNLIEIHVDLTDIETKYDALKDEAQKIEMNESDDSDADVNTNNNNTNDNASNPNWSFFNSSPISNAKPTNDNSSPIAHHNGNESDEDFTFGAN